MLNNQATKSPSFLTPPQSCLSRSLPDNGEGLVLLGCRTATVSSYGAVPTRWWISVKQQSDGRWLIERLAWIRLLNQVPARGTL